MSYDYSENVLVQGAAGDLLRDELGWEVQFAYNTEALGEQGTFGRKSYNDILLTRYLYSALKKLNPWLTDAQCLDAEKQLRHHLSTSSLLQINEEKYFFIRDGIPVAVKHKNGKTETRRAAVIDFQHPENNHFLAVKEMKIHGELYRRRTDIVGFVNGIPLLFIELKRNDVDVQNAYTDNYTDYRDTIPQLFYYNAFLILSNGMEAKVGTLGSKYEFFHEWKRLNEADAGSVALETMLRGICKKENFLDLFENFILYDHSGGNTAKILARNHQYLGVNEAVKAYEARKLNDGNYSENEPTLSGFIINSSKVEFVIKKFTIDGEVYLPLFPEMIEKTMMFRVLIHLKQSINGKEVLMHIVDINHKERLYKTIYENNRILYFEEIEKSN